jgi:hypothetical protein
MACFLIIRFFTLDHCGKVAWGCFIITKIIVLIAQYIQPSSEGWYGVKKVIWIIAYAVLFFCDIVKVDIIYAIVEKTEIFLNKYNTLLKENGMGGVEKFFNLIIRLFSFFFSGEG